MIELCFCFHLVQAVCFLLTKPRPTSFFVFAEKAFLKFFYSRIGPNTTGRYAHEFPYLSLCGQERNFIRCDDLPVVFTELIESSASGVPSSSTSEGDRLLYAGGTMSVPFNPAFLAMMPETGRVYHTGPEKTGGVGLVKSSVAIELSKLFQFEDKSSSSPTHIAWKGQTYKLSSDVISKLRSCRDSYRV